MLLLLLSLVFCYTHGFLVPSNRPSVSLDVGSCPEVISPETASFSVNILQDSEVNRPLSRRNVLVGSMIASTAVLLTADSAHAILLEQPHDAPVVFCSSYSQDDAVFVPSSSSVSISDAAAVDWSAIFQKAGKKALGGGKAGASAAVVQVLSLMWLRTSMNYQYRYGGNLSESLQKLWQEGGIRRLYQGLPFAIVQGPLTRFGDTAANVGVLALLEALPLTQDLPLPLKTGCGSLAAGAWRIVLMPLDASKTALQVQGEDGLNQLLERVKVAGPGSLYKGALAQAAATAAGHFPWFLTYNFLNAELPVVQDDLFLSLVRAASVGMAASCVSDCVSNSFRVIKTTKQTSQLSEIGDLSYPEVVSMIVEKDGWAGLLGRGLQTRLLTNAIQGAAFSVLWKYFQQTL